MKNLIQLAIDDDGENQDGIISDDYSEESGPDSPETTFAEEPCK